MLDTHQLYQKLTGTVGLYSGFNAPADERNLGRQPVVYLSDAHKLLRPDLLRALGPKLTDINPDPYYANRTYGRYDLVSDSGELFESLTSDNEGNALNGTDHWRKLSAEQVWYNRIERGALTKLALSLAYSPPAPVLFDQQATFQREGNVQGALSKSGRFVGVRISIKRTAVLGVNRLGLQLTAPVTNLPLYLFHSDQTAPVTTVNLTNATAGRTAWATANVDLYGSRGGYYLIGYFEGDLPVGVQAVGSDRSFDVAGCQTCGGGIDQLVAATRAPYVTLTPVYVEGPRNTRLRDWTDESEVTRQTWGLNFILEASCDATAALLDNRDSLINALLHVVACDVLEEISTSDRVNAVAAQMRSQAYVALYGQDSSRSDGGLSQRRDGVINDLKKVLAGSTPCVSVEVPRQRRGISVGSVWD